MQWCGRQNTPVGERVIYLIFLSYILFSCLISYFLHPSYPTISSLFLLISFLLLPSYPFLFLLVYPSLFFSFPILTHYFTPRFFLYFLFPSPFLDLTLFLQVSHPHCFIVCFPSALSPHYFPPLCLIGGAYLPLYGESHRYGAHARQRASHPWLKNLLSCSVYKILLYSICSVYICGSTLIQIA